MTVNISPNFWWTKYSRALFILSITYRPGVDFSVEQSSYAMQCFIVSITKLLPNKYFQSLFNDFIVMKPNVLPTLQKAVPKFFAFFPDYERTISQYPQNFLEISSRSNDSMFIWVYLLHIYIFQTFNDKGHNIDIPTLTELKENYNPERLSKYDWGPPVWFIIHMSAMFAPEPCQQSFYDYKSLLGCLQYLLPCAKCRGHLSENLTKINIESCSKTRQGMFQLSWELHNIVNKDTGKKIMSFEEAVQLYSPRREEME